LEKADGLEIDEVKVLKGKDWITVEAKVSKIKAGIHHLFEI